MPPVRVTRTCYLCGPTDKNLCRVPKNSRQLAWSKFCNVGSVADLPKSARICIEHFDKSQVIVARNEIKLLPGAVPTIYTQKQLEKLKDKKCELYEEIVRERQEKSELKTEIQNRFRSFNIGAQCDGADTHISPSVIKTITNEETITTFKESGTEIVTTPTSIKETADCNQRRNATRALRFIQDIHTPDLETPRRRRECMKVIRFESATMRHKVKTLKRQNKRLEEKVQNLKLLILDLQKNNKLSADNAANIMRDLPPIISQIAIRKFKSSRNQYEPELRKFALSLHFYSAKAYAFVRSRWRYLLPHPSTLRKWSCSQNFEPGFNENILIFLKNRASNDTKKLLCNLVIDEMSIRRQLIIKNNKKYGCVNIGFDSLRNDEASDEITDQSVDEIEEESSEKNEALPPLAKNALVFMIVALNDNWKMPIAYFLTDSLTAEQISLLIKRALALLEQHNVIVRSITFDGVPINLTAVKQLGAYLDVLSPAFKPYFPHPTSKELVYVFVDGSHNIKNVRNSFAKTVTRNKKNELLYTTPMYDGKDQEISWRYIEDIVHLQTEQGLRAGNKLTSRHVNYRDDIMRVVLAVQTLSRSTASCLRYLQKSMAEKFGNVAGTATFAEMFNDAFDMCNCRSLYTNKKPYERPLTLENIEKLEKRAKEIIHYICDLKDNMHAPVVQSRRKCGFIGFVICLQNIFSLFRDLNKRYGLQYLLTYKLLQDHLENFFCCVRMKGGFNNNPNAHQFYCAYRLLLQHQQVTSTDSANCEANDVRILTVPSTMYTSSKPDDVIHKLETNLKEKFNFAGIYIPTAFVRDTVDYVGGFVILKMKKKGLLACEICHDSIQDPTRPSTLIDEKSHGALQIPSHDLARILLHIETWIRDNTFSIFDENFLPAVIQQLMAKIDRDNIFGYDHEDEHKIFLIKFAAALYLKVRLHHEATIVSQIDKYIRRACTKLVLFRHQ